MPDRIVPAGCQSFAIAFRHQLLALPQQQIEHQLAQKPDPKLRRHVRQTLKAGIDAPGVVEALRELRRMVDRVQRQRQHTAWLAGAHCSLADIAMLPYVCRLEDLGMAWIWQHELPAVGDWLGRSQLRQGYERALPSISILIF